MSLPKLFISIDQLILDPNNPRFSKNEKDIIQDETTYCQLAIQEETLRKMVTDNEFDINGLEKSLKENGFISVVQPIIVRKIDDHYLVIEGNRRTSAMKELKRKHNLGKAIDLLDQNLLDSFENIEVVDCTASSKDVIDMLLGMIHVGGTKDWELLPSSFYVYKLYLEQLMELRKGTLEDAENNFYYEAKLTKIVAAKASIKPLQVRENLKIYRVYNQIYNELVDENVYDETTFNNKKASLIGDSIKKDSMKAYFGFDENRFLLSSDGLEKWINLMIGTISSNGEFIEKVITTPSTGDSSLRDFGIVLSDGTTSDLERVVVEREKTSIVAADVISRKNKRTLNLALKTVKNELQKIDIQGLMGVAEDDKDLLDEIERTINTIKNTYGRADEELE
jgi:hypothetical protein